VGSEFRIELLKNNVENKGGKDGAKRAALSKAFKLMEDVPVKLGVRNLHALASA
jgi:hypothetical protein